MATRPETVAVILDQLETAGAITTRKMFGEYALYCDGKVVALICDDALFLKPTNAGRSYLGTVVEGLPFPGAKPWFLIDGDAWEDADWLSELIRRTAADLPPPKPKRKKSERKSGSSKNRIGA